MELRIVILSVACLACLVPTALCTELLADAALAGKGALLAKGALVKGALVKGALIKGALIKGALLKALILKGALLKGALLKGALIKGALLAKGALALKGAALAKGALLAKKALVAKGALLAKGAAAAIAAKGAAVVAAKAAAVKGAALLAKGVAAKGAAVAGAVAAAKGALVQASPLGALLSGRIVVPQLVPVAQPVAVPYPALFAMSSSPVFSPPAVGLPSIAGRIAGWAGAVSRSLVDTTAAAGDLVGALAQKTASASVPVVYDYQIDESPRFYAAPVIEEVDDLYY